MLVEKMLKQHTRNNLVTVLNLQNSIAANILRTEKPAHNTQQPHENNPSYETHNSRAPSALTNLTCTTNSHQPQPTNINPTIQ